MPLAPTANKQQRRTFAIQVAGGVLDPCMGWIVLNRNIATFYGSGWVKLRLVRFSVRTGDEKS